MRPAGITGLGFVDMCLQALGSWACVSWVRGHVFARALPEAWSRQNKAGARERERERES